MPGLVPGIHAFVRHHKAWMAVTSTAMTMKATRYNPKMALAMMLCWISFEPP